MFKAIICDLDGTLLNSKHTISQYTCDVIKEIHSKGVKIFIATGRHHKDTLIFKEKLGLDSYIITSNGAKIHDAHNNEVYSNNIPAEVVAEVVKQHIDDEIVKNAYQDDIWYCNVHPKSIEDYYKESGFQYQLKAHNDIVGEITKFFYIYDGVDGKLAKLEERMRLLFPNKLALTYSMPNCFEMQQLGVSKGTAIAEILGKLNIDLNEAIAFGDGLNDYEMLSTVGKGLLMGNCSPRLQALLPDHEVIDTCDNDGVAKYLANIFKL